MPPKFKFTKQQIIDTALEIIREGGVSALTARSLAQKLSSSPKPIFSYFDSMNELLADVYDAASGMYQEYIKNAMLRKEYPPYKASGMAYIEFARQERQLFKWLFMRDRTGESVAENREEIRDQLDLIMKNLNISEDSAYLFHIEMWVFVHGIATMAATSYLDMDTEFASRVLTDAYQGLKHRYTEMRD